MPTKTIHKNGTRPLYEFGSIHRWVEYPAADLLGDEFPYHEAYEGFAVEVLMNPSGEEERAATFALREYRDRLKEIVQVDPNDQAAIDEAAYAYLTALAPRVRAWNASQGGEPIPPPCEPDGLDAWSRFPLLLRDWVAAVTREVTIPKRPSRRSSPPGNLVTTMEPTTEPPAPDAPPS